MVLCTRLPRLNAVIKVSPLMSMLGCMALVVLGSGAAVVATTGLSAASSVAAAEVVLAPMPRVIADSRELKEDAKVDADVSSWIVS